MKQTVFFSWGLFISHVVSSPAPDLSDKDAHLGRGLITVDYGSKDALPDLTVGDVDAATGPRKRMDHGYDGFDTDFNAAPGDENFHPKSDWEPSNHGCTSAENALDHEYVHEVMKELRNICDDGALMVRAGPMKLQMFDYSLLLLLM